MVENLTDDSWLFLYDFCQKTWEWMINSNDPFIQNLILDMKHRKDRKLLLNSKFLCPIFKNVRGILLHWDRDIPELKDTNQVIEYKVEDQSLSIIKRNPLIDKNPIYNIISDEFHRFRLSFEYKPSISIQNDQINQIKDRWIKKRNSIRLTLCLIREHQNENEPNVLNSNYLPRDLFFSLIQLTYQYLDRPEL